MTRVSRPVRVQDKGLIIGLSCAVSGERKTYFACHAVFQTRIDHHA